MYDIKNRVNFEKYTKTNTITDAMSYKPFNVKDISNTCHNKSFHSKELSQLYFINRNID